MRTLLLLALLVSTQNFLAQNEAYLLAKKLNGLKSIQLSYSSNEVELDEASMYAVYGVVNQLYSAKRVVICNNGKVFEEKRDDLGSRRKQWFLDFLRQESIAVRSEDFINQVPSNANAQVVVYYEDLSDKTSFAAIRDTTYFSDEMGWEFTHTVDMVTEVSNMSKAVLPKEERGPYAATQSMTAEFVNIKNVFRLEHPDRDQFSRPVLVKMLSLEGKVKEDLELYIFNHEFNKWCLYGSKMVKMGKKGDYYFFQCSVNHSGVFAIGAPFSFPKQFEALVFDNNATLLHVDIEDPRALYSGQCVIQDNRRVIWVPKVPYPEDTYLKIAYRDLYGHIVQDELSVAYLKKLQSPTFRFLIDLKNNIEEEKSLTLNQEK